MLSPPAEFLAIERGSDCLEQFVFAERLVQEVHSTAVDGLFLVALARSGRDKNDRNAMVGVHQVSLQFQAIHPRHPEVEDED